MYQPNNNFNNHFGTNDGDQYKQNNIQQDHHILLYTIFNQKYVITIEAIYKISNRYGGNVVRIVMIRKKGTQAMVEFDNVETAKRAMNGLQNQDIYSGCCTLKVAFAKTPMLNVKRNDANSWDFSVQPELTAEATRQPLIQSETNNYGTNYNNNNYNGSNYANQNDGRTPVAIVYGLTEKVNCQHLFNLLCLYGNVIKIKFMKSKPGCAMAEFSEPDAVTKSTKLTGSELFGSKLTVRPSKSMFVGEPKNESFHLPDNSPGFEDFSRSKLNRFRSAEKASKNRSQDPRSTVHFFNAPTDLNEEKMTEWINAKTPEIFSIKKLVLFPPKDGAKSSAGLIDFEHVSEAMNCLALYNHCTMDSNDSQYPYSVKFCFATQDLRD